MNRREMFAFLSQSFYEIKKTFLDVHFFRSETNLKDLNISVNKHETCGNVWGKMVELLKKWRPSDHLGIFWKSMVVIGVKSWWNAWKTGTDYRFLSFRVDRIHFNTGLLGMHLTDDKCRNLGVVTWGLPRWHVRNTTEVASNSARRVTCTLAIYKEFAIPKGGLVSNLGLTFF